MKQVGTACALVLLFAVLASAQSKPWSEWTKKDVDKTLNDSAWSQTQSETPQAQPESTSAVTQVMAGRREDRNLDSAARNAESGQAKPKASIKYYVRFLSAKPIRAAFARRVLLEQAQPNEQLAGQLQAFVDRDFSNYIVVTVSIEVGDEKMVGPVMRAFSAATTEALQKNVYLERKDGQKLFLMEYRPPAEDGMGAKFVFKRSPDGQPFLSDSDNVRFFAQLNEKMKVNARYKLSDMLFDGKLEY
jgi:hypothetical protein